MDLTENTHAAGQQAFTPPKWRKIKGNEHTLSSGEIEYDLLALEEFLNNMIAQGWQPVRINGTSITFVPCAPGSLICRTTISVNKRGFFDKAKAAELSELLRAEGATLVPQVSTWGWQMGLVALRPASFGAFDINTDLDSCIAEYEARKKTGQSFGAVFFALAAVQFAVGIIGDNMTVYISLALIWIILGSYYYRPVPRYKKIIEKLRSQRDALEA